MAEEIVNELLVDEKGNLVRGQEGGIKRVFQRLDEIEAKIDKINEKIPEAHEY